MFLKFTTCLISLTVTSCLCAIDTLRYRFMWVVSSKILPTSSRDSVLNTLTLTFGGFPHLSLLPEPCVLKTASPESGRKSLIGLIPHCHPCNVALQNPRYKASHSLSPPPHEASSTIPPGATLKNKNENKDIEIKKKLNIGEERGKKKKEKKIQETRFWRINLRHVLFWCESYSTLAPIFSRAPIVIKKFG